MRIVRFRTSSNHTAKGTNRDADARLGVLTPDGSGVVDLADHSPVTTDGHLVGSLRTALTPAGQQALAPLVDEAPSFALADITHLVPVEAGSKLLCAGANYRKKYPLGGEVQPPPQPVYFNKPPHTLAAHGEPLLVPTVSEQLDYEAELAVIIGTPCRHVDPSEVSQVIAGYTVLNDGSVRNYQRHSVAAGKNFHMAGSVGPHLTTADELPPPEQLTLNCWVNGELRQHASVSEMIFSVGELVAYLSTVMPLEPGDLVSTGSPEGTGGSHDPPRWLKDGDVVRCEVSGVGTLENPVTAEPTG